MSWDPLVSCSSWHGVTTVVMGNCGVGVAPVDPAQREILMWDLVNVEAIPFEVMAQGIDWQWETHPEYLDALATRGMGVNVASVAALTPIRHYVMGEASFERAATPDEIDEMKALVADGLQAGAIGFSTSTFEGHNGADGVPMPSRLADQDEIRALVATLGER